jgi:hypothetical protein
MVEHLETLFPGLQGTAYRVTSPADDAYNCIAWVAGDTKQWWWPDVSPKRYWPAGVPREETLTAFQAAFASLGCVACPTETYEQGFERIALFGDGKGYPLHAARQLPHGRWSSKTGELEDIEHALHDLEGAEYGAVVLIMRRSLP